LFCAGKVDMMVLCAAVVGKPYTLSPQVGSWFGNHLLNNGSNTD
jgi:hypothetical protein